MPIPVLIPGKSLGRYHILEQLGQGGMATVYTARDTRLDITVAIKFIRTGSFPADILRSVVKRFETEARKMAQLSHPNIVRVTDYGSYEGMPFLVMEYLPGGTLRQYMGKKMPFPQAIQLVLPVAKALEYAHKHNLIHRDVKPANILLRDTGEPMLSDFGVAKVMDAEQTHGLTGTGISLGTPEYMAPEQAMGKKIDQRVDIYSLGVILYELITGRRPFTAETPMEEVVKKSRDPLTSPSNFVKGLPQAVEQVLFKALAKDPQDRYASVGEFIQALEHLSVAEDKTSQEKKESAKPENWTLTSIKQIERKRDEDRKLKNPKGIPGWVWGVAGLGLIALLIVVFSFNGGISWTPKIIYIPTSTQMTPTLVHSSILVPTDGKGGQPVVAGATTPGLTTTPIASMLVEDPAKVKEIYSGRLISGWEDWSWDASIDISSTQITYQGASSIKISLETTGGFSLHNIGMNADQYTWLEFFINPGDNAKRLLQIYIMGSDEQVPPAYLMVKIQNPDFLEGGILKTRQWQRVRIPLTYLMDPVGIITRINLQDLTGSVQGDFYLAEIRLVGTK